jgi:fructose-1,6-bisphosphatase/inositol monophosphatase family enzyme
MPPSHPWLSPIRELHREIRATVTAACKQKSVEAMSSVAEDGEGDTLYAVDKISEAVLVRGLARDADRLGGVVLVAEGIAGGFVTLPEHRAESSCRYRILVDPIDGTRTLMYQKRPAWILTGVAVNRGEATRLSDIELAVQTEIPLIKQHLADELWAVRGGGAHALRVNVLNSESSAIKLRPSSAATVEHGFAMVSRLFPGARDVLAAIDEEVLDHLLGPPVAQKARCFEDQYASSAGQLYELMAGHDRFVADLRPLLMPILTERGLPPPFCCHPYDVCTALIAEEIGVHVRNPEGGRFDCSFDIAEDVAWVGYANRTLLETIEPVLKGVLERRNLLRTRR